MLRTARLLGALRTRAPLPPTRLFATSLAVIPQRLRRPFQQKNRRRDQVLEPRLQPGVPTTLQPQLEAWLSSWTEPRLGITKLRADVWGMPLRPDIVSNVLVWQRACMRQGTASSKGRGEVRGGGRKPRPQKGTGRSRQGSIRSPIWRGGGRAFPKKPRDFSYKLPRKIVTLGIKSALSDKYKRNALIVLDSLAMEKPQASDLVQNLTELGFDTDQHKVLLINSCSEGWKPTMFRPLKKQQSMLLKPVDNLEIAAENLENVRVCRAQDANVYDLLRYPTLIVDLQSLAELEHILSGRYSGFAYDMSVAIENVAAAIESGHFTDVVTPPAQISPRARRFRLHPPPPSYPKKGRPPKYRTVRLNLKSAEQ